jgi:hypothetical protein
MVDSADRNENIFPSPFDFQITKSNSLLNGFFSRIGTTEVVLEWCQPNISAALGNNTVVMDVSGVGALDISGIITLTLPSGNYTVAQACDAICDLFLDNYNVLSPNNPILGVNQTSLGVLFSSVAPNLFLFRFLPGPLVNQLNILSPVAPPTLASTALVGCPDLRPYRYIDFVSSDLTLCQDVKDSSTAPIVRDVLCRWYFAWDEPPELDALGFPILMGYTRFAARRIFNPPKQIKWDNTIPIGNLRFQVYSDAGVLLSPPMNTVNNWLMTLQVSEN